METDHKKLEERFFKTASEDDAKALLKGCASPTNMVSIHSPDGIYKAASSTSEQLIGYKPDELVGNSPYDYFHPDDFQKVLKSHAKVTVRPEIDTVDYRIRKKNGSYMEVTSYSRQVRDPSGLEFLLVLTFKRQ